MNFQKDFFVEETNFDKKAFSSGYLHSEERKKDRRINKILDLTNFTAHKEKILFLLANHSFRSKVSLEKKIFLFVFHESLKNNDIYKIISVINLFPGGRNELLRLNMKEFSYTKDLEYNRIIYNEIYNCINKVVEVKYDYNTFISKLKGSKAECVAVFLLIQDFNLEQIYKIAQLSKICSLEEIYKIRNKFKKENSKKRIFSEKPTLKKVFDKIKKH